MTHPISPEAQKTIDQKISLYLYEYGQCPEGHPFSAKVIFDDIEKLNLKTGDEYYPKQWCETCQKWYPGMRPFTVTEPPDKLKVNP